MVTGSPIKGKALAKAPTPVASGDLQQRIELIEVRHNDLLERFEDQSSAYARLEIIMAGLGLLITIIVVFFAFKTEKSAVRAATDAAKDELKDSRDEVDRCVQEARGSAASAAAVLLDIEGHKKVAAADARQIRANRNQVINRKERNSEADDDAS